MLRLSEAAADDLRDIFRHTILAFGQAQADDYSEQMLSAFDLLAHNPRMGRSLKARSTLRTLVFRAHIIVYRPLGEDVLVVRIIDSRRDWRRMLD